MFELYFLTSSGVKFDHIGHLVKDLPILLKPPVDYGKPYVEPRIYDREQLIRDSINDANKRLARTLSSKEILSQHFGHQMSSMDLLARELQNRFFIIEDTSVVIDALSNEIETPGLDVKFWMEEMTFAKLDELLRINDNNRNVTVRSDIALYIPKKFRKGSSDEFYKVFTGISRGTIVESESDFNTNPMYPWLDNKTFNKWFQPQGEQLPISMLPILAATKYDFRAKAVAALIEYLKELNLLGSLEPLNAPWPIQKDLFGHQNLILCGPSCSGKSILASFLSRNYGYYHIEASDFMYFAYYRKHGLKPSIDIHTFAEAALHDDPQIVAREVALHIGLLVGAKVVITGFRSPKELELFISDAQSYKCLFIESPLLIRYERCLKRGRSDRSMSLSGFRERDDMQKSMGLSLIRKIPFVDIVKNTKTLKSYLDKIRRRYLGNELRYRRPELDQFPAGQAGYISLEQSILISLLLDSRVGYKFHTTTEIAKIINVHLLQLRVRRGRAFSTDKNNVSRYFNQRRYPFYEIDYEKNTARYRLSTTGLSYASYLAARLLD
jgi:cytidylate kinase/inosine/xanthosine triphosphate pyrophosphatase family protein